MQEGEQMTPAPAAGQGPWKAVGIIFIISFILAGILAVWFGMQLASAQAQVSDLQDQVQDLQVQVEEMEDGEDVAVGEGDRDVFTYIEKNLGFKFDYFANWHIYGQTDYESPDRTLPRMYFCMNPRPVISSTPSDAPLICEIIIELLDFGEEPFSSYGEDRPWKTYVEEEIEVNGRTITQLTIEVDPDEQPFEPGPQVQVTYIDGFELTHIGSPDEEAWELLKNTFESDPESF